jgi:ferredoxin
MHCVIGSGAAGVACAKAILARGGQVLMLDAGLELEPERAQLACQLAATKPSAWTDGNIAALKGGMTAGAKGIPHKLLFGSDFPYRDTQEQTPWKSRGVSLYPSLALGGLSNTWGAAMLPHRDEDVADWPVKNADLAEHFRAVSAFTGLAAEHDDLEELFPLHCANPGPLRPSVQADSVLRARVAVRAAKCEYCGLCMYGCPYGCIYNSADMVREMRAGKNFQYQGDVIVTTVREDGGKVFITGFNRRTRAPLSFEADRVYLAAGVIPTAQIILRSQSAYDRPVKLLDSQYFLFPLMLARRTPKVETESLYTLCQLFIELCNPRISRRTVHLQIYTYNDLIGQAVRKTFGPLARPLEILARQLEQRLLIVQGFLHSDESSSIAMTLKRNGDKDCLHLDALSNPETRRTVNRVLREMLRQMGRIGGMVLPPMLQFAEPGRGFHCGGSIPMRREPKPFESDCLGRPHGWTRIHAVDATVLPSVPPTTMAFCSMANAHRIGWESANL